MLSKLKNQRTLLRRQSRSLARRAGDDRELEVKRALAELKGIALSAKCSSTLDELRGWEGRGASVYFSQFCSMLSQDAREAGFDFKTRNRRPPTDPVNAALSFLYALLVREVTQTVLRVGFEPLLGFLHQPRHGRPSLALDLMEEFRPILADSTVLMCFNNGELRPEHFLRRGPACQLTDKGRRQVIIAWERRLDQLVTHPVFGYRISYRRVIEVQSRLLARYLLNELDCYTGFEVR